MGLGRVANDFFLALLMDTHVLFFGYLSCQVFFLGAAHAEGQGTEISAGCWFRTSKCVCPSSNRWCELLPVETASAPCVADGWVVSTVFVTLKFWSWEFWLGVHTIALL